MKEITYNKEVLEILKHLSKNLLKSLLLKKENDKVSIRMKAPSIYIDLNTPVDNFNFDGEQIAFYDGVYDKFYQFFDCFKNPSLFQNEHDLVLKEGKNSIKFRVSDPELIEERNLFKVLKKLPESVVKISLDKDQFTSIKRMIKMVSTEDITFKIKGDKVVVSVENDKTKNSYDYEIDLEEAVNEEVEMTIKTTVFDSAPELNYEVTITKVGLFHFKSINEHFELNLYTGDRS